MKFLVLNKCLMNTAAENPKKVSKGQTNHSFCFFCTVNWAVSKLEIKGETERQLLGFGGTNSSEVKASAGNSSNARAELEL